MILSFGIINEQFKPVLHDGVISAQLYILGAYVPMYYLLLICAYALDPGAEPRVWGQSLPYFGTNVQVSELLFRKMTFDFL
jgi:hypothetical protein